MGIGRNLHDGTIGAGGLQLGGRRAALAALQHIEVGADIAVRRHLDDLVLDLDLGGCRDFLGAERIMARSEEHTSELQSLMRNSYAVFCLKKKQNKRSTH